MQPEQSAFGPYDFEIRVQVGPFKSGFENSLKRQLFGFLKKNGCRVNLALQIRGF